MFARTLPHLKRVFGAARARRGSGLALAVLGVGLSFAAPVVLSGFGVFARIGTLPVWVLAGAPALMLLGWIANAGRVQVLTRANNCRLTFGEACLVSAGGDFGAALGPGGLTGIAAYIFLLGRAGVRSAVATALFALERLLDQFVFAAALAASAVGLALVNQGNHPWRLFVISFGLCAGIVVVILAAIVEYRRLLRLAVWVIARLRFSALRRHQFIGWSLRFRRSLTEVARMPRPSIALLVSCAAAYWAARFAILPLVAVGMHAPIPWAYLLAVQVLALFAGQLSLLPGGTVTVEAVFAALLLPWLNRHDLGLMLLVWRGSVFYFTLAAGGAAFALAASRDRVTLKA